MSKKRLFLSYRRDDMPGYVGRLADDLEEAFGKDRVFRDVDDIPGGTAWRQVIEQNLQDSAALILLIGPRWNDIWRARAADPVNYVAYELELARQHGVAVIPVSLGGTKLAADLDLAEVSWLRERQVHDISDIQGRWQHDVAALIHLLEKIHGLDRARPMAALVTPARSPWPRRIVLSLAALTGIGALLVFLAAEPEPATASPHVTAAQTQSERALAARSAKDIAAPAPLADANGKANESRLTGLWISKKHGTQYQIKANDNGRLRISTPGHAPGEGRLLPNMPGKFEFSIKGYGRGQFALSNSSPTMTGWIVRPGSSQQLFDTWSRSSD